MGCDLRCLDRAAGIRGMKLEHMPELKGAWGYPMAPGAIAASAGPLFWRFRCSGCDL
jgi:Mg2+ and Co2+ transporter CorA